MRVVPSFIVFLLPVCACVAAPSVDVPEDLSQPEPVWVRVSGLPARAAVQIEVRRGVAGDRSVDRSQAAFATDAAGVVDTRVDRPSGGSYAGLASDGLFWSAAPADRVPDDPPEGSVKVIVRSGDQVVAVTTTHDGPIAGTVLTEALEHFPGAIFCRPRAAGRYPGIVVLGGSEGGTWVARHFAPLLAARGYAVVGLPYYSPPYDPADRLEGLPTSFNEIPVDRLTLVRRWLLARRDVDGSRIGLWGVSKGAEFALIAASRFDWIKAVVAVVPTDVVWEGWGGDGPSTSSFAFDGRPLPYVPYVGMDAALDRASRGEPMGLRAVHVAGREAHSASVAAATIPADRFRGALLLVAGGRDEIWPSADMARSIADRRAALGLPTTLLVFPDAGHALGGPGSEPAGPLSSAGVAPQANAAARSAAWLATFALFDDALRGGAVAGR